MATIIASDEPGDSGMDGVQERFRAPELKGCPFCGGKAKVQHGHPNGFYVSHSCGWDYAISEMYGYRCASEAEAIAAWNRRPESQT